MVAMLHLAGLAAAPLAVESAPVEDVHAALLRKYLDAAAVQDGAGQCVEAEVTVRAGLPKLDRQAELRALRTISPAGAVTYQALHAEGDGMVRREVIARYLAATSQASKEIAITASHYRFRFMRVVELAGRHIHVFQLSPRQKRGGLFKGELWLDGQTALPVRETGRFVKNPSVFLRSVEFVRDYQIQDGVACPSSIVSTAKTLVGRVELTVQYGAFASGQAQRERP